MRLFVGIPLPKELQENVLEFQEALKKTGADIKQVDVQNLYFTLKFLGEMNNAEDVKHELGKVVQKHNSFEINVKGVGMFPSVVWVGIGKNQEFITLTKDVLELTESFRKEDHTEILPHLTIARLRSARNNEKLKNEVKKVKDKEFGSFTVNSFILYESVLTKNGPVYREITKFYLKGQ